MNTIVSLPIAAAVPVASPSIAGPPMSDASSVEAQLARLAQAVDVLRTRYVCEGWTLDEARADRALTYFRRGCPDDDEEWSSALYFIASHGLSPNWILSGDPSVMIAHSASLSQRAAKSEADPIFALIEEHKKANVEFYAALEIVPGTLNPDPEKEAFYSDRENDVRCSMDADEYGSDYSDGPTGVAVLHRRCDGWAVFAQW